MTDPSRVRVSDTLQPFAIGFAAELARQGYRSGSQVQQLRLMAHVSRWLGSNDLDVADFPCHAERFLRARRDTGYRYLWTSRALRPLLMYLQDRGATPPGRPPIPAGPVDEALARYRQYLVVERGLSERTVGGYLHAVRPFLRRCISADGLALDIDQLSEADVTAFMVAQCAEQSRGAAQFTATALRSLLRFLHVTGATAGSLAGAVPSVHSRRLAGLPSRLEPEHVRRLLAACDRHTLSGSRDFAVITTLARLGLRSAEVATLRLDDVHWRVGELVVQGKGRRAERVPLPSDVGAVLVAYLHRRPATAQGRTLFVRLAAPHAPFRPSTVTHIVAGAAQRAGLGHVNAHQLRHFAATQLLRAGAPLSEIQDFLRHARMQTTAIYAKVDRDALRTIARPWPGGVA